MRDEEHIQKKVRITSIDFDELISNWNRCKRECDDGDEEEIEELPIPVRMIEAEVTDNFSYYRISEKDGEFEIKFNNCIFNAITSFHRKRFYKFIGCEFEENIRFSHENFYFSDCVFNKAFSFQGEFLTGITGSGCFWSCIFRGRVDIETISKSTIDLSHIFRGCTFFEKLILYEWTFDKASRVDFVKYRGPLGGIIYKNCTFKTDILFEDFHQQTFQDGCVFEGDTIFKIKSQDEQIIISQNTAFKGSVTFSFLKYVVTNIEMRNSHFERNVHFYFDGSEEDIDAEFLNFGSLKILGCEFEKKLSLSIEKNIDAINQHIPIQNLTFKTNKFSGPLIADHLKVTDVTLQYNQFSDVASFAHCCFHSIPEDGFAFNSFLSLVNFHQAELPKGFDLSDNLFKEGINFRGVTLTDDPKKHSLNQESCRIIKYSLDKIGNTVEANEYFALEMRNFSHSISLLKNPNKFVIWLSRISSNFGQSWLRPFALLMLTALGYHLGAVLPDIANEYQQTSTLTLQPLFAHNFLEGILPLKKLMGLGSATYKIELTWANALTALIQIYLIWQIILASKRQIKR